MPGPKNRSEALGDDAGVHQTRNRTRLATAREVEVTSRDTNTARNGAASKGTAQQARPKSSKNNRPDSVPAKTSAASVKKKKRAEERQRQEGMYILIVVGLTDA